MAESFHVPDELLDNVQNWVAPVSLPTLFNCTTPSANTAVDSPVMTNSGDVMELDMYPSLIPDPFKYKLLSKLTVRVLGPDVYGLLCEIWAMQNPTLITFSAYESSDGSYGFSISTAANTICSSLSTETYTAGAPCGFPGFTT